MHDALRRDASQEHEGRVTTAYRSGVAVKSTPQTANRVLCQQCHPTWLEVCDGTLGIGPQQYEGQFARQA